MTATIGLDPFGATREALAEIGRRWWIPLVSGIAWFVLAWFLLSFDVRTVWTVAVFTGILLIYGAIAELVLAALAPSWRWLHGILGVLYLVGGVCAFVWPNITFAAMAALVSWMLMFAGVIDIVNSLVFRRVDDLWWLTLVLGIAEIGIALWAIGYPGRSAVLLVVWLATIAISRGIVHIVLALQVRKLRHLAD